jgi:hypothetical protein
MSSVSYIITLMAPSFAALAMSWNLKMPFWIGIALLILSMAVVTFLPAQSLSAESLENNTVEVEPLLNRSSLDVKRSRDKAGNSLLSHILSDFQDVCQAFRRPSFRILLLIFFLASLASSNTPLFPQYISKRYGWTFAKAGYFLSVKAAVNIVLLTIVVPRSINILVASQMDGTTINLLGATTSLYFSVAGAFLVGLSSKNWQLITCEASPTVTDCAALTTFSALVAYAVGSALPVFTMSLVKCPAVVGDGGNDTSQDYSVVMLTRALGTFAGLPLMTVAWAKGIGIGGFAMGAPYFFSAVRLLLNNDMNSKLTLQMFYAFNYPVLLQLSTRIREWSR